MNRSFKRFLTAVALVAASVGIQAAAATTTAVTQSQNLLLDRPFGADIARELILSQNAWQGKFDGWFGTFQVAGQYNRNWNADAADGIGARPFWSGSNVMTVGNNESGTTIGANVPLVAPTTGLVDVDAYQFGLGKTVAANKGSITLAPVVYNAGADFLFFVGQSEDERGFWAKIHGSVGVASIDPKLTEEAVTAVAYTGGWITPVGGDGTVDIAAPYSNMEEAFAGGKTAGVFTGLNFGKIDGKRTSSAKFGDVEFALGYNVFASESAHLGIALRASAPTANKPTAEYVFEPIFGRGGGWGLGGELFGHVTAWEGSNNNALEFWLDAQAMHLFKARQVRSFDLTDNAGSKYLLVRRFNSSFVGQNDMQQLINFSSLDVDATYGAVVDGALGIRYHAECWNVQVGYNFSGRTAEKLTLVGELPATTYGLVGHQANSTSAATSLQLSLVQTDAKINGTLAQTSTGATAANENVVAAAAGTLIAGNSALDVTAAQLAAGWNSKVFANANYVFSDSDYKPTIGVFGDADFSTSHNNAVSKWGVGVFGGISF
jgi:hypothetical protein